MHWRGWMLWAAAVCVPLPAGAAGPPDAKALFDAGGEKSIRVVAAPSSSTRPAPASGTAGSSQAATAPAPAAGAGAKTQAATDASHVGISYQILSLPADGSIVPVMRDRVFSDGERVRILARANRPGYFTVLNLGPTGNTNVLFSEYVEALQMVQIPREGALRMVGSAGTERLVFMLSNDPNPVAPPANPQAAPPADAARTDPPPSASAVLAALDDTRAGGGSKGAAGEDAMASRFSVITPRGGSAAAPTGDKGIVIKSTGAAHYGVVPAQAMSRGGILTLEVRLKHQ